MESEMVIHDTGSGKPVKLAGLILVVVALFLSSGCRSSTSNNQHKLLIYTPHGQDMLRDFVARYKQVHPEVDV